MSPVGPSAAGYHAALTGMQQSARKVAAVAEQAMTGVSPELAVEFKLAKAGLEASARMAGAIDESMGTIIDTMA